MDQTILLNGNTSPLAQRLSELFIDDGAHVIRADEGNPGRNSAGEEVEDHLTIIPWTRHSSVSIHNLLVEAENKRDTIDEVVFVFSALMENKPLHELGLASIDSYIDNYVKGGLYFLREVLGYFQKRKQGQLSIVIHTSGLEVLPPIDAVGIGGIKTFADSMFTLYQNEPIMINGFTSDASTPDDYALFVHRTLTEKARGSHGKWYRHGDRSVWNALSFTQKGR
ncbi:MAG: hypothetical protein U5P10_17340 [Spirochaetia bacterium]|nr:hypothetical protein [Spirochaetia bacterium]